MSRPKHNRQASRVVLNRRHGGRILGIVALVVWLFAPDAHADDGQKVTRARLRVAMTRYAHEPTAERVAELALEAAAVHPERMLRMIRRARARGLLPEIRLGARQGREVDRFVSQVGTTDRLSTDRDLTLEASLTMRLDRLLFSNQDAALMREHRRRQSLRSRIIREVVRLYYERRRMQLERDLFGVHSLEQEMALSERAALLNALTDGAFLKEMSRRKP